MVWFGAKARRPVSGFTRGELLDWLKEKRAPEVLVKQVDTLLDHCDRARFAAAGEETKLVDEAKTLLLALEKELGRV